MYQLPDLARTPRSTRLGKHGTLDTPCYNITISCLVAITFVINIDNILFALICEDLHTYVMFFLISCKLYVISN